MPSRAVCCCGAGTWALVIGWLHTVVFGILAAIWVALFFLDYKIEGEVTQFMLATGNKSVDDEFNLNYEIENNSHLHLYLNFVAVGGYLLVPVILGVILITGVKKRNTDRIELWIVITAICFVCEFYIFCCQIRVLMSVFQFIWRAIWLLWEAFSLLVVNVHWKELKEIIG